MVETYKSPTLATNVKQKYAVLCASPFRDHFIIHLFMCLPFNLIFVERVLIGESQPTKGHSRIETLTVVGSLFSFLNNLTIYNFSIAGHFDSEADAGRRP